MRLVAIVLAALVVVVALLVVGIFWATRRLNRRDRMWREILAANDLPGDPLRMPTARGRG